MVHENIPCNSGDFAEIYNFVEKCMVRRKGVRYGINYGFRVLVMKEHCAGLDLPCTAVLHETLNDSMRTDSLKP